MRGNVEQHDAGRSHQSRLPGEHGSEKKGSDGHRDAVRSGSALLYEQRDVSIDQVLCDPHLVKKFDDFAARLAPGYAKLDYRWAAIALRKARRSAPRSIPLSRLQSLGLLEDVRGSELPTSDALYWIQAGSVSLFTGVASNLQRQFDALVGRLGFNILPDWMAERSKVKPELRICRAATFEAAEMARAGLLRRAGARLNFWHGSFFGGAAA